jgi:hypothetical protein
VLPLSSEYNTTLRNNTEVHSLHFHSREILKSHTCILFVSGSLDFPLGRAVFVMLSLYIILESEFSNVVPRTSANVVYNHPAE